jgi:hypothetical protein
VCIWAADPNEPEEPDTPVGPPQPYSFSYTAGRYPGHVDRTHSETSDGTGTVRGKYSATARDVRWKNVVRCKTLAEAYLFT